MDAVKFLKEYRRICDEYDYCKDCPIRKENGYSILSCNEWVDCNPEKAVKVVEEWSKAHSITNGEKFLEVFGIPPAPGYGGWWDEEYKSPKEE